MSDSLANRVRAGGTDSTIVPRQAREATDILIHKVLAPTFRTFARLDEGIQRYDALAKRVLTEEHGRILDETGLDKRKVFFGAAGTGKTFLAMERELLS